MFTIITIVANTRFNELPIGGLKIIKAIKFSLIEFSSR